MLLCSIGYKSVGTGKQNNKYGYGIRTHLSICGGMEHFIFRLMINVCIVVFRFMEVGFEGCLDMLMLCACCLLLCTLKKHTHTHTDSKHYVKELYL